jgi:hypothetical protein
MCRGKEANEYLFKSQSVKRTKAATGAKKDAAIVRASFKTS